MDFIAPLDIVMEDHLLTATVFKGTTKIIQNKLLDCMLSVLKEYILEEVKSADFIAIEADETTDISTYCKLVLVLCYIHAKSNMQEQFFEFINIQNATANTIATALLERLSTILPKGQTCRPSLPVWWGEPTAECSVR